MCAAQVCLARSSCCCCRRRRESCAAAAAARVFGAAWRSPWRARAPLEKDEEKLVWKKISVSCLLLNQQQIIGYVTLIVTVQGLLGLLKCPGSAGVPKRCQFGTFFPGLAAGEKVKMTAGQTILNG